MLIPSKFGEDAIIDSSLSRRVNANSQLARLVERKRTKLIKKGEC